MYAARGWFSTWKSSLWYCRFNFLETSCKNKTQNITNRPLNHTLEPKTWPAVFVRKAEGDFRSLISVARSNHPKTHSGLILVPMLLHPTSRHLNMNIRFIKSSNSTAWSNKNVDSYFGTKKDRKWNDTGLQWTLKLDLTAESWSVWCCGYGVSTPNPRNQKHGIFMNQGKTITWERGFCCFKKQQLQKKTCHTLTSSISCDPKQRTLWMAQRSGNNVVSEHAHTEGTDTRRPKNAQAQSGVKPYCLHGVGNPSTCLREASCQSAVRSFLSVWSPGEPCTTRLM